MTLASLTIPLLLISGTAFNQTFDRATEAYSEKDYGLAVETLERLVEEGVEDPALFYNLGNAYYRMDRLGPAIANYERVLRLSPGFESAEHNLVQCYMKTSRRLERPLPPDWEQSLLFWHYHLSRGTTLAAAILCWLACWGVLAIRQFTWRRAAGPPRYLRRAALALALASVAFSGSAWVKAQPATLAVASDVTVPVHFGRDEGETVRFELFEGDRVTADSRSGDWVRVTTATGDRGWARASAFTFVGPPYEHADGETGPGIALLADEDPA
ncbi:MAG: tetratricopeptide repeat protein [bacterium]|nr:tetratricopeptide repeat protein [bacterium]